MKKVFAAVFFGVFAVLSMKVAYSQLSPFEKDQEYMSVEVAAKRWGKQTFDAKSFAEGNLSTRAAMAANLVQTQALRNRTFKEIRALLGRPDGYFWSDRIPAYLIFDGADAKRNTWQIVFLPTAKGSVREIRIHKNCCTGWPD